jgi:hypothetical protein
MMDLPAFRRLKYTPGEDPMTWNRAQVRPFVAWPPTHLRITPSATVDNGRRVMVMEYHGRWAGTITETEHPGVFVGTLSGGIHNAEDRGAVIMHKVGSASITMDYFPGLTTADRTELVEFVEVMRTDRRYRDG